MSKSPFKATIAGVVGGLAVAIIIGVVLLIVSSFPLLEVIRTMAVIVAAFALVGLGIDGVNALSYK